MKKKMLFALFSAALATLAVFAFVEGSITINGQFSDWAAVLADPQNTVSDGALGAGDLDNPGQTSSDLRNFALTWDATNLYFYFKRGTTSNSGISCLVYLDADHDGLMEAGDLLLFYSFNNSGFQGFALYHYVPSVPSGDPLGGDGQTPPGSVGALLSTSGSGAMGAAGVRYETSVPWSVLTPYGVTAGSPMYAHPALTLGSNLPTQVQDNGDILDTLINSISIASDSEATVKPGDTAVFSHVVTNNGNASTVVELSAVSINGWSVSFWDSTGTTPLTDTNGNGSVDTGAIAPGATLRIKVKVEIPASTPTQTNDEVTITASSASNSSITDNVLDRIYAGFVVSFKKDQEKTVSPGVTVPYYRQVILNLTDSAITIDVSAVSDHGWSVEVREDTNCDDSPDTGPITQVNVAAGASTCLITYVSVPGSAAWGTTDVTTTTATFGSPTIEIPVYSTTHVDDIFTLEPDLDGSQGAGETILYEHTISNNQGVADVFDIAASSSEGWQVALLKSDGVTPLTDSDGDSIPDSGSIAPYGGTFTFKVRITIPLSATFNTIDYTTVAAASSLTPTESRSALDTTTVKVLVTFADAANAVSSSIFPPCATIYEKAFGLSNGTYRFMVYDSLGNLKTLNPALLSPDQSGQVDDSYQMQSGDPLGTWTVKLQKKSGGSFVDMVNYVATVDVVNDGSITVSTGRPTYNLTGETLAVQSQAVNPNAVDMSGSLSYVVFIDADGNDAPDTGETYLQSNGTTGPWSVGDSTHLVSPFDVEASSSSTDGWQVSVADFVTSGTWKVRVDWSNGCGSPVASSVTTFQVVVDTSPPASTVTWPSNGATLYLSSAPFSITGTASDAETYVASVDVSTDAGTTWASALNSGTEFSTWSYSWTPFYRGGYAIQSRATDSVGHVEVPVNTVNITVVDDTPPTTPVVTDDGLYTAGTLHASWTSQDPNSGISAYRYCIGTSPGACNVVAETGAGLATQVTRSDLTLTDGATYYFGLISTNLDGYDSARGDSDGITADLTGPSSSITNPVNGQTLTAITYTVQGTASDALSGVASVEVSTDGGSTWNPAVGTTSWSYSWTLPGDGNYTLYARAVDTVGNTGPLSPPVTVAVDNPPLPPSDLQAAETGFCQATFTWTASPSGDVASYRIYSDDGTGTMDYATPIATVSSPTTTWTSTRGIYSYAGTFQSLSTESGQPENSVFHATLINANHIAYNLSGITLGWDPDDTPAIAVAEVLVNGSTVYSNPAPTEGDDYRSLDLSPTSIPAGGNFTIEVHFVLVGGGYPEMAGKSFSLDASGGGWSPEVSGTLQVAGGTLTPALANNRTTLQPGVPTQIAVRAVDDAGQEEQNTTVVISKTVCNSSTVQVSIVYPSAGTSIGGDRVTLYGVLTSGSLSDLKEVRFEERPSSGSWSTVVPADAFHPNPDSAEPFITTWNAGAETPGTYELRAVAVDTLGVEDLFPQVVTVTIGASPTLYEYINGSSRPESERACTTATGGFVRMADDVHDNLTEWNLPGGGLSSDAVMTTIIEDPSLWSGTIPAGWGSGDQFRTLSLSSGQTTLAGGNTMSVTIPYDDADSNRQVDTTGVDAWLLLVMTWDSGSSTWTRAASTQVNLDTAVVSGEVTEIRPTALLAPSWTSGDTSAPKAVVNYRIVRSGDDASMSWDPVTEDVLGGPETIRFYYVYRGTTASFTPDEATHSNLYAVSSSTAFIDAGSITKGGDFFYKITAVDESGNESAW